MPLVDVSQTETLVAKLDCFDVQLDALLRELEQRRVVEANVVRHMCVQYVNTVGYVLVDHAATIAHEERLDVFLELLLLLLVECTEVEELVEDRSSTSKALDDVLFAATRSELRLL